MKKAILLIHGFGGTPYEMQPVGRLAEKLGIKPIYAKLPGHGGNPFELEGIKAEDWIEYLVGLYSLIEADFDWISVCGLSLGALLAGILAKEKRPEKLILLAPGVYPRRSAFLLAPFAGFIRGKLVKIADESLNPESNIYVPLSSVKELWRVVRIFARSIEGIVSPTLVIQGLSDEMVKIESAYFVKKRLGEKARLVLIPGVAHVVTLDKNVDKTLGIVKEFLSWPR